MSAAADEIVVTREGLALPVVDVLTGRGFVTGKSGSGKSNTASVVVEGLLEAGHSLLVVDVDGEYWGLKEHYEVLRAGATDRCDVRVDASDAETLVDVALDGQPVILDLSAYLRAGDAEDLLAAVLGRLFQRATRRKQPFLVVVEEVHEFIPQQGRLDEVGEVLLRVAKRGRKHGLGICGISQRPAAVDKDFITQCDWLVWHRLTWDNDTDVVRRLLGADAAEAVTEFQSGEAFLQTDWSEDVRRVEFREKRTYDAGTTPGTGSTDRPSLVPVDGSVLARFDDGDDGRGSGAKRGSSPAGTGSESASSDGGPSGAAGGTGPGEGLGDHTDGSNSAVEAAVELAFMLIHLARSAPRVVLRTVGRAERAAVTAIHDRLPSPAPREPPALSRSQVRWLVRVAVLLAALGVTIVLAGG